MDCELYGMESIKTMNRMELVSIDPRRTTIEVEKPSKDTEIDELTKMVQDL